MTKKTGATSPLSNLLRMALLALLSIIMWESLPQAKATYYYYGGRIYNNGDGLDDFVNGPPPPPPTRPGSTPTPIPWYDILSTPYPTTPRPPYSTPGAYATPTPRQSSTPGASPAPSSPAPAR